KLRCAAPHVVEEREVAAFPACPADSELALISLPTDMRPGEESQLVPKEFIAVPGASSTECTLRYPLSNDTTVIYKAFSVAQGQCKECEFVVLRASSTRT
ncbi:hypothetical protein XELAEV_18021775mg, partial [Xenopus laevis]